MILSKDPLLSSSRNSPSLDGSIMPLPIAREELLRRHVELILDNLTAEYDLRMSLQNIHQQASPIREVFHIVDTDERN